MGTSSSHLHHRGCRDRILKVCIVVYTCAQLVYVAMHCTLIKDSTGDVAVVYPSLYRVSPADRPQWIEME